MASDFPYILSLQPFRTFDYFKFNIIAFLQRFETLTSDSGKMAKDIIATFLLKKSEPF